MFERACITIAITAFLAVAGGTAYAQWSGAIDASIAREHAALCQD